MPPKLHIITANHLERLADTLAELIATPDRPFGNWPLQPETVLVQSKGMQNWLNMAIAERNGVCANIDFPFPNAFVDKLYEQTVDRKAQRHLFDSNTMTFRIMALLPQLIDRVEFKPIRHYLSDPAGGRKSYQLSVKIADILDQYQVFRPEMMLQWASGLKGKEPTPHAWQPILWRELCKDLQSFHRAAIQKQLIDKLSQSATPLEKLPSRVSVFGISHLPPFHLQVLQTLAYQIPVYLFLLNPCRQYWSDIVSDRQWVRSKNKINPLDLDPTQDLHIEQGNRLLASWGTQGKHFFNLIHQMDGQVLELFEDNSDQALLGLIQQDILELHDRSGHDGAFTYKDEDRSIQIHACHSPMREVEALHDQLLDLLENDPALSPRDIIVMTPDIASYAPYIHAVFNNTQRNEPALPYTVADQVMPKESRLVDGFVHLLDLYQERLKASQVIALLAYPHIRKRFEIEEKDLPKIEHWLNRAQIRWAWNGAHRKSHTLPRFEQNTWQHGLTRLVLGYAMAGDDQGLFAGMLPQEGVDLGDGPHLGALFDFVELLYRQMVNLPDKCSVSHWHGVLNNVLDDFFEVDESCAHEMLILRSLVDDLAQNAALADFSDEIPFEVVRDHLMSALNQTSFGTGFLAGKITFCAMLPMRSIPAKVIGMIGMNYDAFPKDDREPAFNLIASDPAAGDRNKRNDDKYLFLEALISARKVFYLSYVGRSIQDNSPIPPSVVIDELLEYIEAGFGVKTSQITTIHPLQAFSKSYYDGSDPRLFSYSSENLEACQAMYAAKQPPPFFSGPIEAPDSTWRHCSLDQLLAFFANPARFLLEQRLGIYLRQENVAPKDSEDFNSDALSRFKIKQELLTQHLAGQAGVPFYQRLKASGRLPHGTAGRTIFRQLEIEVQQFAKGLDAHLQEGVARTMPIDLAVGPFRLCGELAGRYPEKRVAHRLAKMRPQDLLSLYISHLAMVATDTKTSPLASVLVCQDVQWQVDSVTNPLEVLHEYLELYWQGLQLPAVFFPRSSYEYAYRLHQGKPEHQALSAAVRKWQGNPPYDPGDVHDSYLSICFRGADEPLGDLFKKTACSVFNPLFESATKL